MKKFFKILTALAICTALNFGLTNEAQAAEIDSSIEAGGLEVQDLYGPPPPPPHRDRWGRHRHHPPPPPPPPPDGWGRRGHYPPPPPPPPHHRRHDRW